MMAVLRIASDEWRLWYRSRQAMAGLILFAALLAGTAAVTAARMNAEKHHRLELQGQADNHFAAQPDRHPHRMVHYGHYVFRPPAPLAAVDPGVDAVTGESIFLEGHRQNSATFADSRATANVGGFGRLTPAKVYQVFLPLLLIALGHGVIQREREAGTLATLLAQGTTASALVLGKGLALLGLVAVALVPAAVMVFATVSMGESIFVGVGMLLTYSVYLSIWAGAVVIASLVFRDRSLALGVLMVTWFAWTLVIPGIAVAVTSARLPMEGKVEADLRMQAELRKSGDGHNAADPAFAQLRARVLAEYGVDRVEDLPVNFRGVVAEASEAVLTEVLNRYAGARMAREAEQTRSMTSFGWLSPTVAVAAASRTLAGTDLATHHRFLREAEALRFDFVQGLNRVHAEQLAYDDDIRRSRDAKAERRTRVSAENWSLLKASSSVGRVPPSDWSAVLGVWFILAVWAGAILLGGAIASERLFP